jgi:sigma-54 specific flagellar transcriptional regulator A
MVASTNATVLLTGKSGTGKELIARLAHELSPRRDKPFVAVNTSALPEGLAESELFGHEKGAFTGAVRSKKGLFEEAHEGTLFLDEIGEVSAAIQVKLLRVLQERQIRRVGGNKEIPLDVRVVAATNRDLNQAMKEGKFREDLFYRLEAFNFELPPLKERSLQELDALITHFAANNGHGPIEISGGALAKLRQYPWPGNIRELENAIEYARVMRGDAGSIELGHLPKNVRDYELPESESPLKRIVTPKLAIAHLSEIVEMLKSGNLAQLPKLMAKYGGSTDFAKGMEMALIIAALDASKGNRTEAARLLGLNRTTLIEKLKRYEIVDGATE